MARTITRFAIALALVGLGWAARAQTREPDFEIVVSSPGGETTVECRRGCEVAWVERGLNPRARSSATFTFNCTAERCLSGRVGGWLLR